MGIKRYLSNYVVTTGCVKRLSIVEVDGGRLVSIKPFEEETAGTEYVPGVIVVADGTATPSIEELINCIKECEAETAECMARLQGVCDCVEGGRVTLYKINVIDHGVTAIMP